MKQIMKKMKLFSYYFLRFSEIYFTVLRAEEKPAVSNVAPELQKTIPSGGAFHLRTAFQRLCIILRVCS